MATLARALGDWQTDSFQQTLKSELVCLPAGVLPQKSVLRTSFITISKISRIRGSIIVASTCAELSRGG